MTTTVYECGCWITYEMGSGKIISAGLCEKHEGEHPEIIEAIVKIIKERV